MRTGFWKSQFWQWNDFMSFEDDMPDFSFLSGHRDPRPVHTFDVADTARRELPVQMAVMETMVARVVEAPSAAEFLSTAAMEAESFVFPAIIENVAESMTTKYRGIEVFAPDASLIEPSARFAGVAFEGGADPFNAVTEPQLPPPDWLLLG